MFNWVGCRYDTMLIGCGGATNRCIIKSKAMSDLTLIISCLLQRLQNKYGNQHILNKKSKKHLSRFAWTSREAAGGCRLWLLTPIVFDCQSVAARVVALMYPPGNY